MLIAISCTLDAVRIECDNSHIETGWARIGTQSQALLAYSSLLAYSGDLPNDERLVNMHISSLQTVD